MPWPHGVADDAPAPALEVVVDDIELLALAEPGGEEILDDEHIEHVGRLARQRVFGQAELLEHLAQTRYVQRAELEVALRPFLAFRPPQQAIGHLVEASRAHG